MTKRRHRSLARRRICEWVGAGIGHERKYMHDERDKLRAEIAELRDELKATAAKLHERLARLPLVKTWCADKICYLGDVVVHDGNVWQARKDTGKEPGHPDWLLLAGRGRDGIDGRSPRFRGPFDVTKTYCALDVVEFDGSSFVAVCDDPGIPGDDGWQAIARRGGRGPAGDIGPRGHKGARGPRGEDGPQIVSWTTDPAHYRVHMTLSNGKPGPVIDLHPLFERFNEAVLSAVDEAMRDVARSHKLLAPL